MKSLVIFLALLALAFGHSYDLAESLNDKQRSISSVIVEAIEGFREQMPCGFPEMGIPPLAPLKIDHQELNISAVGINWVGEINNFSLYGLNNFEIEELNVNAILSRAKFRFVWPNVNFTTKYVLESGKSTFSRAGNAIFAIKDIEAWGIIKYSLGVIGGSNLRVKTFSLYVKIGSVKSQIENLSSIGLINRKLNEIIEEWFMLAINDNTENLALFTNAVVVPIINEKIGDKTLADIIKIIRGGSGGGGGNGGGEGGSPPVEKVSCEAP